MALVYRTSGPWGGGAGANLSAGQVDYNFYDLDYRLQSMELHPLQPVQISYFSTVGSQFYVHMSDGTVQGPLALPVVGWNFRGVWTPSTTYFVNDVITGPDNVVYIVMLNHISAPATFDPGANDGAGHNAYKVVMTSPAGVLPAGGGPGFVLTKASVTDYDVQWHETQVPPGGSGGQVLQKNSGSSGDASWNTLGLGSLRGDVTLTALVDGDYLRWKASTSRWINQKSPMLSVLTAPSWAPVVGSEGAFMVLTNGTTVTNIIIPADTTQNFPIGAELTIHQDGTGLVTIVGEAGVTILKHASFSPQLLGQYATATVKKTASNVWRLFGLLAGS